MNQSEKEGLKNNIKDNSDICSWQSNDHETDDYFSCRFEDQKDDLNINTYNQPIIINRIMNNYNNNVVNNIYNVKYIPTKKNKNVNKI